MNHDLALPLVNPIRLAPASPPRVVRRALTLWQPWAHAVAHFDKRFENRPWAPWPSVVGTTIAIHAAAKLDPAEERAAAAWIRARVSAHLVIPADLPRGAIVAVARVDGSVERSADPWFVGPYGWRLSQVVALPTPVPCRGVQGLWKLPDDVAARVQAQVSAAPPAACACCPRANEYNGYGSDGPRLFTCPKGCPCHD